LTRRPDLPLIHGPAPSIGFGLSSSSVSRLRRRRSWNAFSSRFEGAMTSYVEQVVDNLGSIVPLMNAGLAVVREKDKVCSG
jgi:hypothetical protein